MSNIKIYHGSKQEVRNPRYGIGKPYNDYGLGFYCTQNIEIAKEWACPDNSKGFVNEYSIDLSELRVTNLLDNSFNILNWIALLLKNRSFVPSSSSSQSAKQFLIENFSPLINNSDIIIGYRADDSYFSFAREFLNSSISLSQLKKAMKLGSLGEQIVLISKNAFEKIKFIESTSVEPSTYHTRRRIRDLNAKIEYYSLREEMPQNNEIFMLDLLRGDIEKNDPRI